MSSTALQRVTLITLFIGVLLTGREWMVSPDGHTHVHVLDVGQGDGIFIVGPSGQQVVIDGGPNLSALEGIGRRMSFFDRSIDVLVLTHPHADHLFAFPEILRRYDVGRVILTGAAYEQPRYEEFLQMLKDKQIPVIVADPSKDIAWDDGLQLDVLWPPPIHFGKEFKGDENDTSVVLKLIYGEDTVLFTGDMEEIEERAVLSARVDIDADILKVAHHGSRSSTSTGFLLKVSPEQAIISAGRDNSFGHPHKEVINRLNHFRIPIHVTAEEGTASIELDGM